MNKTEKLLLMTVSSEIYIPTIQGVANEFKIHHSKLNYYIHIWQLISLYY